MDAEKHIVTIDRHVWTLKAPAHHTEVDKATAVANQERNQLAAKGTWVGDVYLSGDDEHVVVTFDARRPEKTTRGIDASADADMEATDA